MRRSAATRRDKSVRSGAKGDGQDRFRQRQGHDASDSIVTVRHYSAAGEAVRTLRRLLGACRGAPARPRRHPPLQRHVSGCFERLRFSARSILQRRRHPTARAAFRYDSASSIADEPSKSAASQWLRVSGQHRVEPMCTAPVRCASTTASVSTILIRHGTLSTPPLPLCWRKSCLRRRQLLL
jgi:hypothetical protein